MVLWPVILNECTMGQWQGTEAVLMLQQGFLMNTYHAAAILSLLFLKQLGCKGPLFSLNSLAVRVLCISSMAGVR